MTDFQPYQLTKNNGWICPGCMARCYDNGYCESCGKHNHTLWVDGYNKAIKDFDVIVGEQMDLFKGDK